MQMDFTSDFIIILLQYKYKTRVKRSGECLASSKGMMMILNDEFSNCLLKYLTLTDPSSYQELQIHIKIIDSSYYYSLECRKKRLGYEGLVLGISSYLTCTSLSNHLRRCDISSKISILFLRNG